MTHVIRSKEEEIFNIAYKFIRSKKYVNIILIDNKNKHNGIIEEALILDIFYKDSSLIYSQDGWISSIKTYDILEIKIQEKNSVFSTFKKWIKFIFTSVSMYVFLFLSVTNSLFALNTKHEFVKQVYEEILCQEIKHHRIVIRQAILETGWGTSNVYKNKNNLFGFRTKKGYIHFKSWQESVTYYKKWQTKHYARFIETTEDSCYYNFLEWIGYAEEETYIARLKSIKIKHII
jgi:hypothetical protein